VSLGSPQTWNRYAYVGNAPLTGVDPLGLDDNFFLKQLDAGNQNIDFSAQAFENSSAQWALQDEYLNLPGHSNPIQHGFGDYLTTMYGNSGVRFGDGGWQAYVPYPTSTSADGFTIYTGNGHWVSMPGPPSNNPAANNAQSRLNQIINHLQQCGGVYSLVAAAAGNFKIGSIPPNQPGLLPLAVTSPTDVSFGIFNGGNSTTTIDAVNFANQGPVTQTGVVVHEWFHTMQINNNSMFLFTNGLSQKLPSSLGGGFIEDQANAAAADAIKQCGPG